MTDRRNQRSWVEGPIGIDRNAEARRTVNAIVEGREMEDVKQKSKLERAAIAVAAGVVLLALLAIIVAVTVRVVVFVWP